MHEVWNMVPREWIAIACFFLGQWWSDRRVFQARKAQGERLGTVEEKVAHVEGAHELAQKLIDLIVTRGGGHGG